MSAATIKKIREFTLKVVRWCKEFTLKVVRWFKEVG